MPRTKFSKQVPAPSRGLGSGITAAARQEPSEPVDPNALVEYGVAGAYIASGFVHEEFLTRLIGERGRRVYREMQDNDSTIGSILFAIKMLLRAVEWRVEHGELDDKSSVTANPDSSQGTANGITDPESAVSFLEGMLFDDMDHTWDDFISQSLSMLVYGWQYSEIVYKQRNGINPTDGKPSSNFDDGMIGIHKLADRSQESIDRWDTDEYGTIYGMWQEPPNGGYLRYIPIGKAIHFRPDPFKDSPEGKSVLRTAYRSWWFLKNIQEIESIAIERELNGLPVIKIPNAILNGTTAEAQRAKANYIKMVRDVKFNEQGGVVIPSDMYVDSEGNPSNSPQVVFELASAGGSRSIDTNTTIRRYQTDIARTVLAQFLFIGQESSKGGYAQSKNESDLFLRAGTGWLESIATTINRQLIPKIWAVNGLDTALMPYVAPGSIAPENLEEIGNYVQKLGAAGITFMDGETNKFLRSVAGFPEGDEEAEMEPVITFPPEDEEL